MAGHIMELFSKTQNKLTEQYEQKRNKSVRYINADLKGQGQESFCFFAFAIFFITNSFNLIPFTSTLLILLLNFLENPRVTEGCLLPIALATR